jgi:hypothetical protein
MILLRGALASLAVAALFATALPASASHVQGGGNITITFTSQGGNEWWVQVKIGGQGSGTVSSIDVKDYSGPWVPMTKRYEWGYGVWAVSTHIVPTHPVMFRATWPGGAQQLSCWFSHPQGVESCSSPPPPPQPTWTATHMGAAGVSHGGADIAIGKVSGRAGAEVFVPSPTGLFVFTWASDRWVASVALAGNADHVAVGEMKGGDSLAYVSTYDSSSNTAAVHEVSWDGQRWQSSRILTVSGAEVTGLSLGDVEDGGTRELYVLTGHPRSVSNGVGYNVFQVKPHPTQAGFLTTRIATSAAPTFSVGMESLWIGDGNNDGNIELYVAGPNDRYVWRIDAVGTTWSIDRVDAPLGSAGLGSVVVGDPDRDGRNEVYVVSRHAGGQDAIWRMESFSGGIATTRIYLTATGTGLNDLFYGDGDHDGKGELFASQSPGALVQLHHDGTQWRPRQIADVRVQPGTNDELWDLVLGDGDNDGKREVYATGFYFGAGPNPDHNVYRIATAPSPAAFASFSNVRGNEWWQQAKVSSAKPGTPIVAVDVSINGGEWKPLKAQSWGADYWAGSYKAAQGAIVQLRAIRGDGLAQTSACYQWIPPSGQDASTTSCGSPPSFSAAFGAVKGNQWWVQTNVAANRPLAGVDARVNCAGSWIPLTLQSWGGWAKSFHVDNGAKIDFRARSTDGAVVTSGGYVWPQATPASAC